MSRRDFVEWRRRREDSWRRRNWSLSCLGSEGSLRILPVEDRKNSGMNLPAFSVRLTGV